MKLISVINVLWAFWENEASLIIGLIYYVSLQPIYFQTKSPLK